MQIHLALDLTISYTDVLSGMRQGHPCTIYAVRDICMVWFLIERYTIGHMFYFCCLSELLMHVQDIRWLIVEVVACPGVRKCIVSPHRGEVCGSIPLSLGTSPPPKTSCFIQ
jgi:hypothetical protein